MGCTSSKGAAEGGKLARSVAFSVACTQKVLGGACTPLLRPSVGQGPGARAAAPGPFLHSSGSLPQAAAGPGPYQTGQALQTKHLQPCVHRRSFTVPPYAKPRDAAKRQAKLESKASAAIDKAIVDEKKHVRKQAAKKILFLGPGGSGEPTARAATPATLCARPDRCVYGRAQQAGCHGCAGAGRCFVFKGQRRPRSGVTKGLECMWA